MGYFITKYSVGDMNKHKSIKSFIKYGKESSNVIIFLGENHY